MATQLLRNSSHRQPSSEPTTTPNIIFLCLSTSRCKSSAAVFPSEKTKPLSFLGQHPPFLCRHLFTLRLGPRLLLLFLAPLSSVSTRPQRIIDSASNSFNIATLLTSPPFLPLPPPPPFSLVPPHYLLIRLLPRSTQVLFGAFLRRPCSSTVLAQCFYYHSSIQQHLSNSSVTRVIIPYYSTILPWRHKGGRASDGHQFIAALIWPFDIQQIFCCIYGSRRYVPDLATSLPRRNGWGTLLSTLSLSSPDMSDM